MPAKKAMKQMPAPKKGGKQSAPAKGGKNQKAAKKEEPKKQTAMKQEKKVQEVMKKAPKVVEKSPEEKAMETLGTALRMDYGDVKTHNILLKMYEPVLETPVENRDQIQIQGVSMLETHLKQVSTKLDQDIQEQIDFLAASGAMKIELESKKDNLERALETLKLNEENAKGTVTNDEQREGNAEDEVKEAERAQKKMRDDALELNQHLEIIRTCQVEKLELLINGPKPAQVQVDETTGEEVEVAPAQQLPTGKVLEKTINEIVKHSKNIINVEDGVTNAIPSALKRPVQERGQFDNYSIDFLSKAWRNWVMDAEYKQGTKEERENEAQQRLDQLNGELGRVRGDLENARAMLSQVQASIKQNKKDTKEIVDELKGMPGKVDEAKEAQEAAESKKSDFNEAYQAFTFLKNHTNIPEPEDQQMDGEHGASPDLLSSKNNASSSSNDELAEADQPIQPQEIEMEAQDDTEQQEEGEHFAVEEGAPMEEEVAVQQEEAEVQHEEVAMEVEEVQQHVQGEQQQWAGYEQQGWGYQQ